MTDTDSSRVLKDVEIDRHHSILTQPFEGSPVLVLLIIYDRKHIMLTQAKGLSTWVAPQSAISRGDGTLYGTMLRESTQELGLSETDIVKRPMPVLGKCLTPTRLESGEDGVEQLFFMPVSVARPDWGVNSVHMWAQTPEQMLGLMATLLQGQRLKFLATCEAVGKAFEAGLLKWSCGQQGLMHV